MPSDRPRWWRRRVTMAKLEAMHPGAAIEEVGDRREIVIYTGLSAGKYDDATGKWTDEQEIHPMPECLD